jgi:hypothetical protein
MTVYKCPAFFGDLCVILLVFALWPIEQAAHSPITVTWMSCEESWDIFQFSLIVFSYMSDQ